MVYLITDFMGHGNTIVTMLNNRAKAEKSIYNVVLFSYADNREKFEQDIDKGWDVLVDSINPSNLSISKAIWDDRESLLEFDEKTNMQELANTVLASAKRLLGID